MKNRKHLDNILTAISCVLTVLVFIFTLYWSVMLMRLGAFAESEMPSMQPEAAVEMELPSMRSDTGLVDFDD